MRNAEGAVTTLTFGPVETSTTKKYARSVADLLNFATQCPWDHEAVDKVILPIWMTVHTVPPPRRAAAAPARAFSAPGLTFINRADYAKGCRLVLESELVVRCLATPADFRR